MAPAPRLGYKEPMRRFRSTKIVATLGPATTRARDIKALFEAGADVFRFNFSHGDHSDHRARFRAVRKLETDKGRPIAVMADLQAPSCASGPSPTARLN